MPTQLARPFLAVSILAALTFGCGPAAIFRVETSVHPDGSCDRTIFQPKGEFLPAEALKPEWNARWTAVAGAKAPPSAAVQPESPYALSYFTARGKFASPREIPPHYRYVDENCPDAGASELLRGYERRLRVRCRTPVAGENYQHRHVERLPEGPR